MKFAVLAAALLAGCSGATAQTVTAEPASSKEKPAVQVAAAVVEAVAAPIPTASFDGASWAGFGVAHCSYLAPASDFIGEDGGVDVVWHFHAGQMATSDMKASGMRAVFVSCGYGIGTGGYSSNFEDPNRFGAMMRSLTRTISFKAKRDVHLQHLALASWSAGFAAVNRVLASSEWYEKTDAVLLFDSLHAQYIDLPEDAKLKTKPLAARGADHVDANMLRRFIRFATDAAAGKKRMVITHSSIVPPDYASTAEATAALLREVDVAPASTTAASFGLPSMVPSVVADAGNLHVRGFRGIGPHDHFDHLHLIGEALRSWIVPGWYSAVSERR
ncbi:MAG: hypothetical protein U0270_44430 [Labilithrix sp.]